MRTYPVPSKGTFPPEFLIFCVTVLGYTAQRGLAFPSSLDSQSAGVNGNQQEPSWSRYARILPNGVVYDPFMGLSRETVFIADGTRRFAPLHQLNGSMSSLIRVPKNEKRHLSDEEVLRTLGFEPHNDSRESREEHDFGNTASEWDLSTVARKPTARRILNGSQSQITVMYSDSVPEELFAAFDHSAQIWADTFPSKVALRVLVSWMPMGETTLAAAVAPFFVPGNSSKATRLDNHTSYSAAMASSLQGMDFAARNQPHLKMTFNSNIPWHFNINQVAPLEKWDLTTTALHEVCHGLFFSGTVQVRKRAKVAGISPLVTLPGRFDRFLAASTGAGIATSCQSRKNFFRAITNRGLRFTDPESSGTDFGLFSPVDYERGSSTYHLDPERLLDDCVSNGISTSPEQCSDLMTERLPNGYTQHSIGEPTLRIMRAVRGGSAGVGSGSCAVKPGALGEGSNGQGGLGGAFWKSSNWVVYIIGATLGVGIIILVSALLSMAISKHATSAA